MKIDRLLETSFLFLRWREGEASAAETWLRANPDLRLGLPWIVKAEFLRGAQTARQDMEKAAAFLERFPTHWPDGELLALYAGLFAGLPPRDQPLSQRDRWIAASALRLDVPLVTRNTRAFGRVQGLKLDPY